MCYQGIFQKNLNRKITKIKTEIKLNYDSKIKVNTKKR